MRNWTRALITVLGGLGFVLPLAACSNCCRPCGGDAYAGYPSGDPAKAATGIHLPVIPFNRFRLTDDAWTDSPPADVPNIRVNTAPALQGSVRRNALRVTAGPAVSCEGQLPNFSVPYWQSPQDAGPNDKRYAMLTVKKNGHTYLSDWWDANDGVWINKAINYVCVSNPRLDADGINYLVDVVLRVGDTVVEPITYFWTPMRTWTLTRL